MYWSKNGNAPSPCCWYTEHPADRHRRNAAGRPASYPCRRSCGRTASRYRYPCPGVQRYAAGYTAAGQSPGRTPFPLAFSGNIAGCTASSAALRVPAAPDGREPPAIRAPESLRIPPAAQIFFSRFPLRPHPPAERTCPHRIRRLRPGGCLPPWPTPQTAHAEAAS